MNDPKEKDYSPFFDLIGFEPIYEGELFGLSHEDAKNLYFIRLREGFYDEDDY